jgi:hypothetical protein
MLAVGCRLTSTGMVQSPLNYAQQESAILDIVPKGTPREQAIADLKTAGISGSFGVSDSIYYCDTWRRRGGETWHLDVALLFDETGKLYEARQADAQVEAEVAPRESDASSATANVPSEDSFEEFQEPESIQSASRDESDEPAHRPDRSNPFAEEL